MVEIDQEGTGIIIEMKYSADGDLESDCQAALCQIVEYSYDEELRDEGMKHILKYGIACYKKRCRVMLAEQ